MVLIKPLDSTPAEVSATGRGNGWQSWPQGAEKEQIWPRVGSWDLFLDHPLFSVKLACLIAHQDSGQVSSIMNVGHISKWNWRSVQPTAQIVFPRFWVYWLSLKIGCDPRICGFQRGPHGSGCSLAGDFQIGSKSPYVWQGFFELSKDHQTTFGLEVWCWALFDFLFRDQVSAPGPGFLEHPHLPHLETGLVCFVGEMQGGTFSAYPVRLELDVLPGSQGQSSLVRGGCLGVSLGDLICFCFEPRLMKVPSGDHLARLKTS